MPSASPIPVSMFTMKTERLNSSESSVTSPIPTMIATIAINTGTSPATTAPNTSTQDHERGREPEAELAALQVALRKQGEVVSGRVGAGDRDLEARSLAVPLYQRDDGLDRRIAADEDREQNRVPVRRDERGRDDVRHLSGRVQLTAELRHERAELRAGRRISSGRDDDNVTRLPSQVSRRRRKRSRDRRSCARRFRIPGHGRVRRQPMQRRHRESDRHSDRDTPPRQHAARPRRADTRQPLSEPR